MREITLTEVGDDRYEVHRNRVPLLTGADLDLAKRHIRKVRLPSEKVTLVERPDGYRTDITREFDRKPTHR